MATWNYQDRVVLITGGTGGLGTALAKEFMRSGAKVYACGVQHVRECEAELETLVREAGRPSRFAVEELDVRDVEALRKWITRITETEKRVDVLVNAAGICPLTDVFEVTPEQWDDVMNVNLRSAFFATQAVLKNMLEQKSGSVINIGSTAGYNGGIVTTPAYGASKGGLHTLTKWFAAKFSGQGLRFNTVVPGPFETRMIAAFPEGTLDKMKASTPRGELGTPSDVVQAVMFLADEASRHMTGAALDVCGGIYLR